MSSRYAYKVYECDSRPAGLSCSGFQWQSLSISALSPPRTFPALMQPRIERLALKGWEIEAPPRFGFCFIRRGGERWLLILTPKDAYDNRPQSSNLFK